MTFVLLTRLGVEISVILMQNTARCEWFLPMIY